MSQATQALATMSVDDAQGAVRAERQARRDALQAAVLRNPNGKLAAKASALLLDYRILDDLVAEATPRGGTREQGEDELIFRICAQVASRVPLTAWCTHYCVDRGLVWALLSETPERYGQYLRALHGVADEYVSEVVALADTATVETLAVDKWQGEARLKVAAVYHPERFTKQTKVTHEVGADFGEMLRRARERVIEGEVLAVAAE